MFRHEVPSEEPPIGTVAAFHYSFRSGGGAGAFLLRTPKGWADNEAGRDAQTWQELTDLDYLNAEIIRDDPKSQVRWASVQVRIIAGPQPKPKPDDSQRLAELEAAVRATADRFGIPTRILPDIDVHPVALLRQIGSCSAAIPNEGD